MPKLAAELSAIEVGRLVAPGFYAVGRVAGLHLHITPSGSRSWVLRAVVGAKRRDIGLGAYPGVSLAEARKKAQDTRDAIAAGNDPVADKRAARAALKAAQSTARTFKAVALAYIEAHKHGWKNEKHGAQWRSTLEAYAFPVLGDLLVAEVTKEHVLDVLRPIWTTKTETASRVRSRIELVLSYAMQAGYRPEGLNPARWRGGLDALLPKPSKVAKVEHRAALPVDQMYAFMPRLAAAEGMGARALHFAILTAARSGEVRGATWAEIDIDGAVWTIPANRMKAGREHRVPLSAAAVELLNALPRIEGNDLLFPAVRGGQLSDATMQAVIKRMGLAVVPHGFRSTFRDWSAERTNYPRDLCEMALAHVIKDKAEAAYRRGDLFEKRRKMMADWSAFIATPPAVGKVYALKASKEVA